VEQNLFSSWKIIKRTSLDECSITLRVNQPIHYYITTRKLATFVFEQQLRPLSSSNQRARIQYELLTMFVLILVCPQSNCHLSKFITIFALNHQLWFQSNLLLFMTGGANPGMSRMSLFSGCTSWNFERY
jgi:hypothetical protein